MRNTVNIVAASSFWIAATVITASAVDLDLIRRNRELLTSQMKDPGSVQFNIEKLIEKDGRTAVCGEFNAKNSFGGYIGYQRWIGLAPYGVLIEKDTKDFKKFWTKACEEPKNSSKPKEHLPLSR